MSEFEEKATPTQPYLIVISDNPDYTGEIPKTEPIGNPQLIEASRIILFAGQKDASGEDVAVQTYRRQANLIDVARLLSEYKDIKIVMELIRHQQAMEEIAVELAAKELSHSLDSLSNLFGSLPDDFLDSLPDDVFGSNDDGDDGFPPPPCDF